MPDTTIAKDPKVARNEAVVRAFVQAWRDLDVDAAMALLAPDIEYINQPLDPIVGHAGVRKIIQSLIEQSKVIDWELKNVFGSGDTVCTERLDCWDFDGNGIALRLPCVGMFDINAEGKIRGWRDYFDIQLWSKSGGPTLEL